MEFCSTNSKHIKVSLKQAVTQGLAPDNGLYMPKQIERLPQQFIKGLSKLSNVSIAYEITRHLIGDDVPDLIIKKIIDETVSFEVPLVPIEENVWALELFHGPTLAFKDFGARFMASLLAHFVEQESNEITILVATSGDTGSAVAHGFHNVPGIKVVVLYPSGKISELQEKQFTTLGNNIIALEVEGTFDDCQRLVKTAFQDKELRDKLNITSANSINIARLIPQSFYYFFTVAQLPARRSVVFSVPSGNFGNLTGGIIAMQMGLPVKHFVAATNVNDVVPRYLEGGKFLVQPSLQTISNAMDVGNPSNFVRLLDLFNHDFEIFSSTVSGYSFTDNKTREAILKVYKSCGYIMDPHGAVAYLGLKDYTSRIKDINGVFLETAHPGKFKDVVEEVIGKRIKLPDRLETLLAKEKRAVLIRNRFEDIREFLIS